MGEEAGKGVLISKRIRIHLREKKAGVASGKKKKKI